MVVEPGDDLGVGTCGEAPVAEVRLPHLVGQIGSEPDIGRLRAFLRVGLHETQINKAAPDRGGRHGDLVALLEVPGNGVRAGIEALGGQLRAQVHHQLDGLVTDLGWRATGTPGPGLERRVALSTPAGHPTRHRRLRDLVLPGCFGRGSTLDHHRQDCCATLRHNATIAAPAPCTCPDSYLAHVLNQHTVSGSSTHGVEPTIRCTQGLPRYPESRSSKGSSSVRVDLRHSLPVRPHQPDPPAATLIGSPLEMLKK